MVDAVVVFVAHALYPLSVATDEVQQWEQKDPDDIDKVPIQSKVFNKCHVPCRIGTGLRLRDHESENRNSNNHVQCMHAGHGEVEKEIDLRVPSHIQGQWFIFCDDG